MKHIRKFNESTDQIGGYKDTLNKLKNLDTKVSRVKIDMGIVRKHIRPMLLELGIEDSNDLILSVSDYIQMGLDEYKWRENINKSHKKYYEFLTKCVDKILKIINGKFPNDIPYDEGSLYFEGILTGKFGDTIWFYIDDRTGKLNAQPKVPSRIKKSNKFRIDINTLEIIE